MSSVSFCAHGRTATGAPVASAGACSRASSRMVSVQRAIRSPWNGGSSRLRLGRCFGAGVRISECGPTIGSSSAAASPPAKRSWSVRISLFVSASVPQTIAW